MVLGPGEGVGEGAPPVPRAKGLEESSSKLCPLVPMGPSPNLGKPHAPLKLPAYSPVS